jgi:hypothetical protein
MESSAAQKILDSMKDEKNIRLEIRELIARVESISKPSLLAVLNGIVEYAENKYKRQEELLNVLRSINKKE